MTGSILIMVFILGFIYLFIINKAFRKLIFKKGKIVIIISICAIMLVGYLSGYRMTSVSAAKANDVVDRDSILINETHRDWVDIYYFFSKSNNMNYSVIVDHKGVFYQSSTSVYLNNYVDDNLSTVGEVSYIGKDGKSIKTLLVKSHTDEISYIEAGAEGNRQRLDLHAGEQVLFEFDNAIGTNDLNPIAFNKEGEEIYYYGYPKGVNNLKPEDYKWHKINAE